jgi:hypothetical protein
MPPLLEGIAAGARGTSTLCDDTPPTGIMEFN